MSNDYLPSIACIVTICIGAMLGFTGIGVVLGIPLI
jgi:hypothetical protein